MCIYGLFVLYINYCEQVATLRKKNEVASDVKYLRFESKMDFIIAKYQADIHNIDMV